MAGLEPYSPCPCGSGQKFKWCCQKVEAFADKARRLFDNGQAEAAIKVLDEGLRKEAGNPWLLTRKAVIQINEGDPEAAKTTLRQILQKHPQHLGSLVLLTRCVLETESPLNGAGMLQQVLSSVEDSVKPQLTSLIRFVALYLVSARRIPAAIKHFDLLYAIGDPDQAAVQGLRTIDSSPSYSPWLKDRLALAEPGPDLDSQTRERFEAAVQLANQGLWAKAAAVFDALAVNAPGSEADYNLGLCRLWLGDEAGAVGPIRNRSRRLGNSVEAVDLEVLAQLLAPIHPDDKIELVELTWPLRNRDALLASLRAEPVIFDAGPTPADEDDPETPAFDNFILLDRPAIEKHSGEGLTADDLPMILGRIAVAQDSVLLEALDDGRVDSLGDRFTALAGSAIAPAHPRTRIIGEEARSTLTLAWQWLYPDEITPEATRRIDLERRTQMIRDRWPVTPMPYLGFRTPEKAAKDGDAEVPLRAVLCQFERELALEKAGLDLVALRARLNLPPEPPIDPATVDLSRLSFGRYNSIKPDQLDDDRLIEFYRRSRRIMLAESLEAAARAIIARPALFEQAKIEPVSVYADLSTIAISRGDKAEAKSLIAQGRQADLPSRKALNAPLWDMIEVRHMTRTEPPETWVPELAIILERYEREPAASQILILNLVELGLVQISPNPDDPQDLLLDTRPLQAVMAEYGPRVTTSSGRLGVSATKPEVWTPGTPGAGSTGGIWTPGSGSGPANPPGGDKPKLIIPGR